MYNTWVNGCYCNACFPVAALSASVRKVRTYTCVDEKGTTQQLEAHQPWCNTKERGMGWVGWGVLRTPELQLIIVTLLFFLPLLCSASPILSTVRQPLAVLLASPSLSQWVSTSQWIYPECWHEALIAPSISQHWQPSLRRASFFFFFLIRNWGAVKWKPTTLWRV